MQFWTVYAHVFAVTANTFPILMIMQREDVV